MTNIGAREADDRPAAPWWRFPMVWFVLAGPALVIVAGIVTTAIAFAHADPTVVGTAAASTAADPVAATAPALQARNHAATPRRRTTP